MYTFFAALVRFTPKYFILFDAIVSRIVFVFPLQIVRYLGIEQWIIENNVLILYPATNSYISSNRCVCVNFLGFSTCKIMSSENGYNSTSFFPIWMPFYFFPAKLLWLRLSALCSIEEARVGILASSRGKTSSLSPLSMKLAVAHVLWKWLLLCWDGFLPFLVCWVFLSFLPWQCAEFCHALFTRWLQRSCGLCPVTHFLCVDRSYRVVFVLFYVLFVAIVWSSSSILCAVSPGSWLFFFFLFSSWFLRLAHLWVGFFVVVRTLHRCCLFLSGGTWRRVLSLWNMDSL